MDLNPKIPCMSLRREEGKDSAFCPSSKGTDQFPGFIFDASLLVCPLHSSDATRENIRKIRSDISCRSTVRFHFCFIAVEGWIKPTQERNMSMSLAIRSADFLPNGCDQRPRGPSDQEGGRGQDDTGSLYRLALD